MGVNPLRNPVEDEDPLPPTDARESEGARSGSSAGSPTGSPTSGPGEGSSGSSAAGASEGNSAASQPAPVPSSAAQGAQTRLSASIQAGQAAAAGNAAAAPAVSAAQVSAGLPTSATPAATTAPTPAPAAPPNAPPTASEGRPAPVSAPAGSGGLVPLDPNIAGTEGQTFSGVVAQFSDSDGNTNPQVYSVTVSYGDGSAPVQGYVTSSNGVFSVQTTPHQFLEEGSFTATTTVTDTADNSQTTVYSPVAVADAVLSGTASSFPPLTAGVGFSGMLGHLNRRAVGRRRRRTFAPLAGA